MSNIFGKALEAIGIEYEEDVDIKDDDFFEAPASRVRKIESDRSSVDRHEHTKPIAEKSAEAFFTASKKPLALMKMFIVEPENFDQVKQIADLLREKRPAIVNLENAEYENARKIIDFLSGTIYALGGTVHKISAGIILFAPDTLEVESKRKKNSKSDKSDDKNDLLGENPIFKIDR